MNESIVALISAFFGAGGLKLFEQWLQKGKEKDDTAANLRAELRTEVTALREELKSVETQLDEWKGKYYDLLAEFIKIKNDIDGAK